MAGTSSEKAPMELLQDINGNHKVILRESGSCAEVSLFGGRVTSWKNVHGEELLFLSSKAIFNPPDAIHGGIAICFPQFSDCGPLKQDHGFATNKFWTIDEKPILPLLEDKASVDLILKPSEEDFKICPHSYEFRLRITLIPGGESGHLRLTSQIINRNINNGINNGKAFKFTLEYHTYLRVSDISEVRVEGLDTIDYFDKLKNMERSVEQEVGITFEGEVNRIYLNTPTQIAILDYKKKRTFKMGKDRLPDAVLRKPWDKKAEAFADIGDDECSWLGFLQKIFSSIIKVLCNPWDKKAADLGENELKYMLCMGAAAVENPITLKAGERWEGYQELSTSPSCIGEE